MVISNEDSKRKYSSFVTHCDGFAQSIKVWSRRKEPLLGKHIPNAGNNRRIAVSITIKENDHSYAIPW
jgi:hypothetical protein